MKQILWRSVESRTEAVKFIKGNVKLTRFEITQCLGRPAETIDQPIERQSLLLAEVNDVLSE